ncbi:MAG TPA: hypothetical protein VGS41_10225, partial [Chthonomonadales bacterium]|nr:hypothetical protein [Chthonomonadales bacterium]
MVPIPHPRAHRSLPTLTIKAVAVDTDSAKVEFEAVPGAKDYRIYDCAAPRVVKYAGLVAKGSKPNTEIEWNGLPKGRAERLVVEAVDRLGPAPLHNITNERNSLVAGSESNAGMFSIPGANEGPDGDGEMVINGQGDFGSEPGVIARSKPFTVTASGRAALPSGPDASQVTFDTFSAGKFKRMPGGPGKDCSNFRLESGTDWDILFRNADVLHTTPFVMAHHFMDVLFDGGTPGASVPLHVEHGIMAMTPLNTAQFSNGRILHVEMEVDAHLSPRRWIGIAVAPAEDPITNWYQRKGAINRTDRALFCEIFPDTVTVTIDRGPKSPANAAPASIELAGAAGQALHYDHRPLFRNRHGRGLDDRSRFDLYVSNDRYAVLEDGATISSQAIPGGLGFKSAKTYFVHYVYH